jgi:hypothetical protein
VSLIALVQQSEGEPSVPREPHERDETHRAEAAG